MVVAVVFGGNEMASNVPQFATTVLCVPQILVGVRVLQAKDVRTRPSVAMTTTRVPWIRVMRSLVVSTSS